jgi:hypothetical protein
MNPYRVILVVDRAFGTRVRELPEGTPAWIVDSPANHPAIVARWEEKKEKNHLVGLTSFRDSPQLSPADLAASMIEEIEMHHGVYSHEPPFSRLTVINVSAAPALTSNLEEIGFGFTSASDSTLEFSKKEEPNKSITAQRASRVADC